MPSNLAALIYHGFPTISVRDFISGEEGMPSLTFAAMLHSLFAARARTGGAWLVASVSRGVAQPLPVFLGAWDSFGGRSDADFTLLDNYNTEHTERLHIDLAKDAYRSTKDEFLQMALWRERAIKSFDTRSLFNGTSMAAQHHRASNTCILSA
ncbi:hypothetical protein B0H14DRAFT_3503467 [Mycena olivaceomarginata]|nr:hypothetical protein B0H14DRAFT_3503467 [Mycena olivaceomarginata]